MTEKERNQMFAKAMEKMEEAEQLILDSMELGDTSSDPDWSYFHAATDIIEHAKSTAGRIFHMKSVSRALGEK